MAGRGRGGRQASAGGRTSGGRPGSAAEKLFATIDSNGDGVITREEMKDAMRAFVRLDINSDGRLTAQEAGASTGGERNASMRARGGQGQAAGATARRGKSGQRGRGGVAPSEPTANDRPDWNPKIFAP